MFRFWKKNREVPRQIEAAPVTQVVEVVKVPVPVPSGLVTNTIEDFIVERGKKLLDEHPAEDVARWLETVYTSFYSQSSESLE